MRRLAALVLLAGCSEGIAQVDGQRVRICDKATGANCAAVNSSGQVSIAGSISASTTGRATAAAPSYTEGTDNPLSIDLSGNIRTLATAQTAAKATAADPAYVEGTTDPISQDLSGHLRTTVSNFPASQAVTGTFWQATQPVSGTFWQATQPVSGTVAVSNAFALDSSVNGLLLSQESATSGQKGPIAQCAVTTVAPTYTTAKTDPLSCTTTGALRVDGSGVTQPVSGTFWQTTQPVSGTFWQATQPVSAASLPLPTGAATEATLATLATSANQTNGTQKAIPRGGAKGANTAADITSSSEGADHQAIDVQIYHNGTSRDPTAIRALTASDVVTATQGNAGSNAQAWWTQIGDTANGPAAVKAASTAAVATDKALVVAVSPNNTVAATESGTWTVQPGNTANTTPWLIDLNKVAGTATVTGGLAGSVGTGGLAAEGAAISGNPVYSAGRGFNAIAFAPRYCDKIIAVTTLSTTATVQQIAAVASQKIYICGYLIKASTATTGINLKWVEGTGSNCVTGQADVTPTIFTTPTAAPATANWTLGPFGSPGIPWMATATDALCINQSATTNATTLSGVIFYTQN